MKARDGRIRTTHTRKKGKSGKTLVDVREERTGDPVIGERLSNVGYSAGYTRGLPNYSSVKVEISCHLPCLGGEEIPTFRRAHAFVIKRLKQEARETMEDLAKILE